MMNPRAIADRLDGLPSPNRSSHLFKPKSSNHLPVVQEESDIEDDESDACQSMSPFEGEDSISWRSYDSDARPTKVKFKMSSNDSLDKLVMPTHSILKVKTPRPFSDVAALDEAGTNQHLRHDIGVLQNRVLRGHHSTDYGCQSPFTYAPDQVLVQLYMFDAEHHGGMWQEAGRYIKYEENVEGIDTMWSRPHVPFLPFLNVMILRKLLESDQAMCALDVDGITFGEICHNTATLLEEMGAMNHEDTNALVAFLNFRRDHAKNNQVRYNWIRKLTGTGRDGVASFFQRDPPSRCMSTSAIDPPKRIGSHSSLEMPRRSYDSFTHHLHSGGKSTGSAAQLTDGLLLNKRTAVEIYSRTDHEPTKTVPDYQPLLTVPRDSMDGASFHSLRSDHSHGSAWEPDTTAPDGTECLHLLVGRTGFSENTKFIFIRLKHALYDPLLTKKRVPIRFLVLIVGPTQGNTEYLEMGRVFASMCTNKEFVATLYHLNTRQEMLHGFDTVLQQMTMIPPSAIDSPDVFSVDEYEKVVRRSKFRHRKKSKKHHLPKIVEGKEFFNEKKSHETDISLQKNEYMQKPKLFEGLFHDFKNIRERYASDFLDIRNGKAMALITTISVYLSLLMPTIAFGKILQKITDQSMGVMECFYSTAISGLIWGLFSAQPMLIQSVTGPIVIFEGSFFMLCNHANLNYMEVRLYAGFTIALCSLLTVTFNGSRLLKYITGFTEEIFCSLIALIYVMETGHFLYHEYVENPSKGFKFYKDYTNPCLTELIEQGKNITVHTAFECDLPRPNAGLMAILVVIICFGIAFVLYQLRFSELLGRCVRNYLSDFNILITLVITSILIYFLVSPGILNTVEIPENLQWTNATLRGHGFIIIPDTKDLQQFIVHVLAGVSGGVMVFVLEFAETAMCEIMLEQKERKFQKRGGINWDLIIMSICALISSIFGLPWMCAAGVQSLSHAQGLSYPKKTAPGAKPEVDYVIEQRVTTISLAVMFAGTTFMSKYLNELAVPCLFGIFLYVGTTSMIESTLFKGLVNAMHFGKHFRHTHTDMNVPANRIRIYRLLQLVALITIYTVKQFAELAILFPVVFIMFIVCRHSVLPFIYTEDEINALDPIEEFADSETNEDKSYQPSPVAV